MHRHNRLEQLLATVCCPQRERPVHPENELDACTITSNRFRYVFVVSVCFVWAHLHQGLLTLVTCSKTSVVVAEAVIVLRQLLQQNPDFEGSGAVVCRLSVLLLQSFLDPSGAEENDGGRPGEHDQSSGGNAVVAAGAARASLAQPGARASIIWTLGEYHQHISGVATDVLRVLAKAFPELEEEVKMQVRGDG